MISSYSFYNLIFSIWKANPNIPTLNNYQLLRTLFKEIIAMINYYSPFTPNIAPTRS